ncbi:hypothetical protein BDV96DRAFT_364307 [Lophiotrema nucula]|uniref:Uncharacterized protein n=1 Tax=Lophiotrema nucula TaxID=690887 RepID=A0A6A5ZJ42_9PLEO|nr:hypothetical protein BDV96DRAFT_364307 [Lophiotrema nucula]
MVLNASRVSHLTHAPRDTPVSTKRSKLISIVAHRWGIYCSQLPRCPRPLQTPQNPLRDLGKKHVERGVVPPHIHPLYALLRGRCSRLRVKDRPKESLITQPEQHSHRPSDLSTKVPRLVLSLSPTSKYGPKARAHALHPPADIFRPSSKKSLVLQAFGK